MLESIKYRMPPFLKEKLIWYAGIGFFIFDIALVAVYAIILSNPEAMNETLRMADELEVTLIRGG